jgi:hypothetical protein
LEEARCNAEKGDRRRHVPRGVNWEGKIMVGIYASLRLSLELQTGSGSDEVCIKRNKWEGKTLLSSRMDLLR